MRSSNAAAFWVAIGAALLALVVTPGRQIAFQEKTQVTLTRHAMERMTWSPAFMWTWPSSGAVVVSGTVRNTGDAPSNLIRVVVTLKDGAGAPIGVSVGFPPTWRLCPGQEAPFVVPTFPSPFVAGYDIRVEEARAGRARG